MNKVNRHIFVIDGKGRERYYEENMVEGSRYLSDLSAQLYGQQRGWDWRFTGDYQQAGLFEISGD